MPDLPPPDPHPPSADGVRELPEEIGTAIDAYGSAEADSFDLSLSPRKRGLAATRAAETRLALTAAILSRLTAAEAGREEAEKQRDQARRGKEEDIAILREVMAENEQLRAANMKLQEIVAADDAKAIAEYEWEQANLLAVGRDKAATARDAALARVERLEKALEETVRLLNLHANDRPEAERWTYTVTAEGDLRVQMPPGVVAEPHSALTEAGRLALKDA